MKKWHQCCKSLPQCHLIETVTEVEPDELSVISLDDLDDEVVLVESDDESMVMMSVSELDELNKMLLDDPDSEVVLGNLIKRVLGDS